jgi:hypothetical protein
LSVVAVDDGYILYCWYYCYYYCFVAIGCVEPIADDYLIIIDFVEKNYYFLL